MAQRRSGLGLLAGYGAMALAALAIQPAAADSTAPSFPFGGPVANPFACLGADVFGCSIIYGGSGLPIPHQDYVDAVNERFA